MDLQEYKNKRDFNITNEPKGKKTKSNKYRFVIQKHKARVLHYDFRLEYNKVLLSWAVPKNLSTNSKVKRLAVHVEDHPVDYINFEGTIPKGQYGAGTVEIFDKGTYVPISDFSNGLKVGELKFYLFGEKFQGVWTLVKKDEKNWFIVKCKNEYILNKKKNKKLPFKSLDVQLALLSDKIPKGENWLFEIKYDGYRIVALIENGKVKLITRNGQDYTKKFPNVVQSLEKQFKLLNVILDGEMVVFDQQGRSDFSLLLDCIKQQKKNFSFVIFDILAIDEFDLRQKKQIARKNLLKDTLTNSSSNLIFSEHIFDKGQECFNLAKEKGLEGIIAKNALSEYAGNRNGDWLKIKCYKRQEFVVCGYTKTEKNQELSSLIVGYYSGKNLIFVGKVGTGFDLKSKSELNDLFSKIIIKKSMLNKAPKNTIFIKPIYVAEIQFAEFTKDNVLRQPSFIGLREDKKATDVIKEDQSGK